jgi:hypothetical protein
MAAGERGSRPSVFPACVYLEKRVIRWKPLFSEQPFQIIAVNLMGGNTPYLCKVRVYSDNFSGPIKYRYSQGNCL